MKYLCILAFQTGDSDTEHQIDMALASKMTFSDLYESIQSKCEDYGDFLAMDCIDEIVEQVWESWDFSLQGMDKYMAYSFHQTITHMVYLEIKGFMESRVEELELLCD
jgi:hypothetical protein